MIRRGRNLFKKVVVFHRSIFAFRPSTFATRCERKSKSPAFFGDDPTHCRKGRSRRSHVTVRLAEALCCCSWRGGVRPNRYSRPGRVFACCADRNARRFAPPPLLSGQLRTRVARECFDRRPGPRCSRSVLAFFGVFCGRLERERGSPRGWPVLMVIGFCGFALHHAVVSVVRPSVLPSPASATANPCSVDGLRAEIQS